MEFRKHLSLKMAATFQDDPQDPPPPGITPCAVPRGGVSGQQQAAGVSSDMVDGTVW